MRSAACRRSWRCPILRDARAQPARAAAMVRRAVPMSPQRAGLRDPSIYGGVDRKRFIIETNGAGVALVDYDNDGWLDALDVERHAAEGRHARGTSSGRPGRRPTNRLYRNLQNGTFQDVTGRSGLARTGWASCCLRGRLRQRRLDRSVPHLLRPERAVSESQEADGSRTSPVAPPSPGPTPGGARAARSSTSIVTAGSICSSRTISFRSRHRARAGQGPQLSLEGHPRQLRPERSRRPTRTCCIETTETGPSPISRRRRASPP